jgi:Arc/MetJ-type ribon-helix-helix transcriptional regulator
MMFHNTCDLERTVPAARVAITIDEKLLGELDRWVANGEFPNRSRAVQEAVRSFRQARMRRGRLLRELARLDPNEERALADEAFTADEEWPAS